MVRVLSWCGSPGPQSAQVSKPITHRNLTPRFARKCGPLVVWVSRPAVRASFQAHNPSQLNASLRSSSRPSRGVGLQARSPRKFPSTATHRNLTPRCARLRGPGGPHYVQSRTTYRTALRSGPHYVQDRNTCRTRHVYKPHAYKNYVFD